MNLQKGFSLMELLIVVALIGIIAAIAIPNLLSARRSANGASAQQTLRNLNTAQVTYALGIGRGNYTNNLANLGGTTSTSVGFLDDTVTSSGETPVENTSFFDTEVGSNNSTSPPTQPREIGKPGPATDPDVKPGNPPRPVVVRKIVKNGEMVLTVKVFEPFSTAFEKQVSAAGGYIAQSQINRGVETISSARIMVRVPPEKLDWLVSWLGQQGVVTTENTKADDISDQYYDLRARLENARKFEGRLLEILKTQTGNLQDVVLVEEKLNQVREQIEQLEGKLLYFDNIVGLSTLTVNVNVEEHFISPQAPTFGEQSAQVWRDSWQGFREFAKTIGLFVIWSVPWLVLLGGFIWVCRLVVKLIRRLGKKSQPMEN